MSDSLFQSEGEKRLDRYVRVVVERGIDSPDAGAGLTYCLTPSTAGVSIGERVLTPLGRGDRKTAGIVVEVGGDDLLGDFPASKVKPLLGSTGVRLPEPLIELARWMADYYICPFGMVLAGMLPAAVKKSVGRKTRVELEFADAEIESKLPPATAQTWAALSADRAVLPATAKEVAQRLELSSTAPLGRLVKLGLLREVEHIVFASPPMPWEGLRVEPEGASDEVEPTAGQLAVVEGVCAQIGTFAPNLLHGVTSSGKTEVYLRVMHRVLDRAQTALMLVPEIALTPQTAGRVLRRFGSNRVAVLHSGLTASQRSRQWAHAISGECKVVIGARSAIFAPLPHLGLIIVDEEHGSDYKQDQLPRYNARDVAVKRGQIESCPVILGSATPSLESWANARSGRFKLWSLPDRVGGGRLPRVEVVDLMAEQRNARSNGSGNGSARELRSLGPTLTGALRETLDDGGQAILLLNRRGFSNILACPSSRCGWVLGCEDCDSTMVLHRHRGLPAGELLRCHHCMAERLAPSVCPTCGSKLIAMGTGTQRLEVELRKSFEQLSGDQALMRIDGDTMKSAKDYFAALSRFADGHVRVLMGTQIVSKGLDFPNVRLVGVVSADTALWMPDFRASERTFQLVSQVAGRAGRGEAPGRVVVQTLNPDQPAIRYAARHAYEAFADEELAMRRRSGLPPATRMARIVVRDQDRDAAMERGKMLADRLQAQGEGGLRVVGPMPAPIERVAGQHRIAIELIAPTAAALLTPLAALRSQGLLKSDAQTAVDVDPVWLM